MTRSLCLFGVVALLGAAGCSSGSGTPFGRVQWEVACPQGTSGTGCAISERVEVQGASNEVSLRCTLDERSDGTYVLDFFVRGSETEAHPQRGQGASLQASNVRFDNDGRVINCEVEFQEFETRERYVAGASSCGPNAPGEAQPCQIANIGFDHEAEGGPWVQGDILCREVPGSDSAANKRDLNFPNRPDEPAQFVFTDCRGNYF